MAAFCFGGASVAAFCFEGASGDAFCLVLFSFVLREHQWLLFVWFYLVLF